MKIHKKVVLSLMIMFSGLCFFVGSNCSAGEVKPPNLSTPCPEIEMPDGVPSFDNCANYCGSSITRESDPIQPFHERYKGYNPNYRTPPKNVVLPIKVSQSMFCPLHDKYFDPDKEEDGTSTPEKNKHNI
jgi:hypothetical protein